MARAQFELRAKTGAGGIQLTKARVVRCPLGESNRDGSEQCFPGSACASRASLGASPNERAFTDVPSSLSARGGLPRGAANGTRGACAPQASRAPRFNRCCGPREFPARAGGRAK